MQSTRPTGLPHLPTGAWDGVGATVSSDGVHFEDQGQVIYLDKKEVGWAPALEPSPGCPVGNCRITVPARSGSSSGFGGAGIQIQRHWQESWCREARLHYVFSFRWQRRKRRRRASKSSSSSTMKFDSHYSHHHEVRKVRRPAGPRAGVQ